ncbi:MAG: peptidoglycan editing factor PgeF [Gammaproteobacteria bacterium]
MSERWLQSGSLLCLEPIWPAPSRVRARVTTRLGGVSQGSYASFNLATHVGDRPEAVQANRLRLEQELQLPARPCWMNQVHGAEVLADPVVPDAVQGGADASCTRRPGTVLAVLTADCLPVFFADRAGLRVGLAHAGWRGLACGVLQATLEALGGEPRDLLAWIGPGIEPERYETGPEVRSRFGGRAFADAFRPSAQSGHAYTDLARIASLLLAQLGVGWIGQSTLGTGARADDFYFYSYRREGETGRMASLIYLEPDRAGS